MQQYIFSTIDFIMYNIKLFYLNDSATSWKLISKKGGSHSTFFFVVFSICGSKVIAMKISLSAHRRGAKKQLLLHAFWLSDCFTQKRATIL